jgi:copper chaperone CopZ
MQANTASIMKHLLLLLLAAFVLMASCSTAPEPAEVAADAALAGIERVVNEVAITSGTPVTVADLSIDGMSCEMMCGGSIKKALAKLPGVAGTDITFVEGDERDHAIVTYDESQVTDAQMVEAIQALHDGQYKVLAVTITKQVRGAGATTDEAAGDKEKSGVSVYAPSTTLLPNVVSLLAGLLRG